MALQILAHSLMSSWFGTVADSWEASRSIGGDAGSNADSSEIFAKFIFLRKWVVAQRMFYSAAHSWHSVDVVEINGG